MKLLLVFTLVFGFCFFGSTVALQCYQCKDITLNTKCEEIIIKACGPEFGYCGTLSLVEKVANQLFKKVVFQRGKTCAKQAKQLKLTQIHKAERDHCYVARVTYVTVRTNFTMETFCSQQSCWVVCIVLLVGCLTECFFDLRIKNFPLLHFF